MKTQRLNYKLPATFLIAGMTAIGVGLSPLAEAAKAQNAPKKDAYEYEKGKYDFDKDKYKYEKGKYDFDKGKYKYEKGKYDFDKGKYKYDFKKDK